MFCTIENDARLEPAYSAANDLTYTLRVFHGRQLLKQKKLSICLFQERDLSIWDYIGLANPDLYG